MEVSAVDCDYLYPRFAASFLLVEDGGAAFVECNTSHAVPKLLAALSAQGLDANDVRYLFITHAHLDHSAGAATLLAACPNAEIVTHPKAARHLIDPTRLVSSAKKVYGEETFEKLYGKVEAVSKDRVKSLNDGEEIQFGSWVFEGWHTLGHASHHICFFERTEKAIFTGDSFGLCYPDLQTKGPFIFPSTSPVDFSAKNAIETVFRIGKEARTAYLTHFGKLEDIPTAAGQLVVHLQAHERIYLNALQRLKNAPHSDFSKYCQTEVRRYFSEYLKGHSFSVEQWEMLELDITLNGDGLFAAAKKSFSQLSA